MKILAVSGGVDSMVMLDILCQEFGTSDILVAHFNHGTRPSSLIDEDFVKSAAVHYGVPVKCGRASLGENTSEDTARTARYNFLFSLAKNGDKVYTAHHIDDLIETIAINLARGTGWRGLAPMSQVQICRPLLEKNLTRADILRYAAEHNISFRFDPTNAEDKYLRNRIRTKITALDLETRKHIYHETVQLYQKQTKIRQEIEKISHTMIYFEKHYPRALFKTLDDTTALELLHAILEKHAISATRPQLLDFLKAIRTYAPEKKFNLPKDHLAHIHKTYFVI